MPIFEYKCRECQKTFDHIVLSSTQAPPVCPECGAEKPDKQVSSFSTSGSTRGGGSGSFSSAPT